MEDKQAGEEEKLQKEKEQQQQQQVSLMGLKFQESWTSQLLSATHSPSQPLTPPLSRPQLLSCYRFSNRRKSETPGKVVGRRMMMMMVMRECSWSALSSCLCQPVMRKMRVSELRGKGSCTPWSVGSETELASGGARCLLDHSPSPVISVPVPVPRGRKKAKVSYQKRSTDPKGNQSPPLTCATFSCRAEMFLKP